jgi:hypothetical protein
MSEIVTMEPKDDNKSSPLLKVFLWLCLPLALSAYFFFFG